jgi:hypothetical protein
MLPARGKTKRTLPHGLKSRGLRWAKAEIVTVKLWVPRQVETKIEPIDALAEINTAYPQTFIQEGVATSLGLQPAETIKIPTATKPVYEAHQFLLRIVFPAADLALEVMAVEVPYILRPKANGRIKCLIGRDILQYWVLIYNGPANTFSLKFQGQ